MFDTGYFLYMAESSGLDDLVTTKEARINAAINDFVAFARKGYDINDMVEDILNKHNLDIDELSDRECARIKREVERRV